ncbi:retrotransposon protein, putative, ty1-copia subclass [Tanacetum coccineum]
MFVIEQPIPPAPAANSEANVLAEWNALYDAYNEVACLMLGSMTPELHRQFENYSPYDMLQELKSMFEKQAGVERFDLIQTFHACKHEEGKPVGAYVLKMKDYVEQLERLGYVLPQDLSVGLILNGLTSDFTGFVRNYNMHNMEKKIGELHAMLIEYEQGLPKKAETPQVIMIKGGKIQKANNKSLKAKGKGKANGKGNDKHGYIFKPKNPKPTAKEHPTKDDTCHHCKEGFREARKLKQGALYLYVGNGVRAQVEAIGSFDLVLPNGLVICLDNCHYAPSITRGVVSVHHLVKNGFVQCFTDFGISISKNNVFYFNAIPSNGIYEIDMHDLVPNINSIYNVSTKRAKQNLDYTYLWHCHLAHIRYPKETIGYYFYFPPKNKIVVARYAEFFEKNLITQEVSRRAVVLKEIQDEDTLPSEITSKIPMEVEGSKPPQEEDILILRSKRTRRAPNCLSLNIEVEEHSLGDLNKPTSYKSAMLDFESNKWIDAMNAEIQSMMDNMVWVLVDLPPSCKTVRSKWIFKKKTDMDGIVHTYKARLIAKGYTQLYGVDYEETYASFKDPFMVLSKHQEAGIKDLMRKSKKLNFELIAIAILDLRLIEMEAVWIRKFILGLAERLSLSSQDCRAFLLAGRKKFAEASMCYVPLLELPVSRYVMKGVYPYLVEWSDLRDDTYDIFMKSDDDDDDEDRDEVAYGEATVEIFKNHKGRVERLES